MLNPDRVAFTVFGKDIYWYGVLMAIGIILAVFLAMREGNRKKLKQDTIIDLCLVIIPCGIVGARLYYVLYELDQYIANPISILYVWEGGLAIYGAVIGGLLGAFIFAKKRKIRFLTLCDCIAPGLVLAQAIGRWGNFFNQEAFGNPVTDASLLWFPMTVRIDSVHYFNGVLCTNPYHLATFFYESMWCLIVFIVLWSLRKKFKHDGDVIFTYALMYCFERMFVEGLRGDSLWLVHQNTWEWLPGGIRVSQLLSAVVFIAVGVFFIVRAVKEKKAGKLMWPAPMAVAEDEVLSADESIPEPEAVSDDAKAPEEPEKPEESEEPEKPEEPANAEDGEEAGKEE